MRLRMILVSLAAVTLLSSSALAQSPGWGNSTPAGSVTTSDKVGIGTTTPATKLHVDGDLTLTGAVRKQGADSVHLTHLPWFTHRDSATGYLKLVTPIISTETNIFSIRIFGTRHSPAEPIEIQCVGYAYAGNGLTSQRCDVSGTSLPVELATETRSGNAVVVVRVGTPSSVWYFPTLSFEYSGWVAKSPSDFQWVMNETTPAATANFNKVFVDDMNGKVRIGEVSSPENPLVVAGPATSSQSRVTREDGTGSISTTVSAADVAMIGLDTDLDASTWMARSTTVGWINKSVGHLIIQGAGSQTAGSPVNLGAVSNFFDLNLSTGAIGLNGPAHPAVKFQIGAMTGANTLIASLTGDVRLPSNNGNVAYLAARDTTTNQIGLQIRTQNTGGTMTEAVRVTPDGSVGIGTTTPTHKLTVAGDIHSAGNVSANGTIFAKYQDVAEWVPAIGDVSAGTVVVLNPQVGNEVMPSHRAYDTTVAGVVSAQPGLLLGVPGDSKAQIATTGRVKVRVDASRGAIAVGDLLVTSDKPGAAMKSVPLDLGGTAIHRPGTLIGKALESLPDGEGEILVLLSLQ